MPDSPVPADVIVATHFWGPGWPTGLEAYLRPRAARYRWIGHPLFPDGSPSTYRLYDGGVLKDEFAVEERRGPLRLLQHLYRTVRWARRAGHGDLLVAGDNLITLAGLWLRWRGVVDTVVLYTIDFVPRRFGNTLANWVYHRVDRFAVAHADVVWNTADGINLGREQRDGRAPASPQLTVPIGADVRGIAGRGGERTPGALVFLGSLLEKQGLQVILDAMPAILERHPGARLLVIGDGPYRADLEAQVARLGISSAVTFAGFMQDHHLIEAHLLESVIGLAPYTPDPLSFSQFQDLPGKIVNYLACGLPVIATDVPRNIHMVAKAGAGTVIDYTPAAAADAILAYLDDPGLLRQSAAAAAALGARFDWDEIFERAFAETDRLVKERRR